MSYRSNCIRVDLDALRHNLKEIRETLEGTPYLAVVKADAYGHGAVGVSRVCLSEGAAMLGVAIPEEGEELRRAGIDAPILVLSGVNARGAEADARWDLIQTVYDAEGVEHLEAACEKEGKRLGVHVKADTGMGRIGVRNRAEMSAVLSALARAPRLELKGIYTHFAAADEADEAYTHMQAERFDALTAMAPSGLTRHASASAALCRFPELRYDMVRAGIVMYGCPPWEGCRMDLRPVMRWTAEVSCVREFSPGEHVGYGHTFTAPRGMTVAVISAGYGDGYPRLLSNRGAVLVRGTRCPIVGRVCMDVMMADVTGTPGVRAGDEAVLMGESGKEAITADEIAALTGTISYEILLSPSRRVDRVTAGE